MANDNVVTTEPEQQPDAAEAIRQQQRGDQVDTRETEGETPPAPGQPIVDLANPDTNTTVRTTGGEAGPLNRATVEDGNIIFSAPGAPVEPEIDSTAATVVKPEGDDTASGDTKLPGQTAVDEFAPEYNALPAGENVKLSPEAEKEISDKMAEFRKKLEENNYSIQFEKGEGPWNAITRQQQEARAKQASGKELTPQETAILGLKHDDVMKESRRIRDRDFKVLKTEDGKPRNWYKLHEPTGRWSEQEMNEMMAKEEKSLRDSAEKAAMEAAKEAEAEKQRQLAEAIEKNVPSEEIVKDAATAVGLEGDPKAIRDNMKAHVAKEIAEGTLKPEDLSNPYPRVEAALVGAGALTGDELKAALAKQTELRTAAEAEGREGPRLDQVLNEIYKDDPERLAKLDKAGKFYDELKKRAEAAVEQPAPPQAAKEATTVVDDPFNARFSELPPKTDGDSGAAPEPAPRQPVVDSSGQPVTDGSGQPVTTGEQPVRTDPVPENVQEEQTRRDVLQEVTERNKPEAGADVRQAPSGYLALKAFQAAGLDTRTWTASNEAQQAIADALANPKLRDELPGISSDILDGKASVGDVDPVNQFLASKNIDIKLDPIGQNEIAFAATLGVKGQWAGTATEIEAADGKKYPGVLLKDLESYQVGDRTVVKLYTGQDGIEVYATPMPDDISGEEALRRATALTPNADNSRPAEFTSANIPMVQMDARTRLEDLVGMSSDKGETISRAEMQTKLNLDQHGFSVDQGLAVVASRGISLSNDFNFDKPFLLWVKTADGSQPLAAVRVDERFWKDPKQAK